MLPKLIPLDPFPPGANPFYYDAYHMGTQIGKDLLLMHRNHVEEECKYLIFVNNKTGERFRMEFEGSEEAVAFGVMADDVMSGRK